MASGTPAINTGPFEQPIEPLQSTLINRDGQGKQDSWVGDVTERKWGQSP
jgi:hypothetical protein